MVKEFFEAVILLLFGASKQDINNFLYSKDWYRKQYPIHYFIKINGNWDQYAVEQVKLLEFKKGIKVEDIRGPGFKYWIQCQNIQCKNVVNFTGEFHGKHDTGNEKINFYTCTCCGLHQQFIIDIIPIPCDMYGNSLEAGITIEA
jgi:hypothetical protein